MSHEYRSRLNRVVTWLPQRGYVPNDRLYYEYYTGGQVGDRYVVDICVPVKHI
ncbi:hypothetical protein [Brevibacillus sp. IT-7CA2]|uniref:hypothetical protein n=1 Tax=Brevibacillus sp. IT-7CA2 TaxID=3026436 RepID=UPI0039E0C96B